MTKYTNVQIIEKDCNPETGELTLAIDCIKITESEHVELNLSLPASSDKQK